jgi:homoserine O-acetyltransferase
MTTEVTQRSFTTRDFSLASGALLPEMTVAYRTLGQLNAAGDNAVLVLHGYTTGPTMLEPGANVAEGSWAELVGPGRPIDSERWFVICPNMLGSCYGSTGPASVDPRTGQPYGVDFPAITALDIVNAQKALLDHLGVTRLAAVAGPSFGAYQSFQWAAAYPQLVERVIAAVGSPWHPAPKGGADAILKTLEADPGWTAWLAGDCAAMLPHLTAQRVRTLTLYGVDAELAPRIPDPQARALEVQRLAREWAEGFDPMSLVVLMRAAETFDVRASLPAVPAPVLYVISRTDPVFSPALAREVAQLPGTARWTYVELDSDKGHFASGADAALWAGELRRFMDSAPADWRPAGFAALDQEASA